MKEPLHRWVRTMRGISGEAGTSAMAPVNIDVHIQLAPTSAAVAAEGQPHPDRLLVLRQYP